MRRAQNTVKRGSFWRPEVSAAGAAAPLSYFGKDTARGPLAGFKRLRATAGQGPNYVGPFCGYVGLCWPILRAMWAHLVAMLAYVGLMLMHVEPKDPKTGNSKKNTIKRRIFWWSVSWDYVGPSWGYVGPSWGYVGPSWSYVGPSWGYVGPAWGYVGPSWGPCWPILGAMLAHLEVHVGACWPLLSHKLRKRGKMGRAQNTVKRGSFWGVFGGGERSAAGGAAPLSYGEERNAYGYATARGPLAGCRAGQGPNYVGPSCGYVGLCWRTLAYLAGTAKKQCKMQEIFMVGGLSWGYVGPPWGYVALSWGQCGPILGLCWSILGLCWPILGLCWPILGLCWPILGAMLAQLGAMLAHLEAYVGPCWPILSHKGRKMGKKWDEHKTP